MLQKKIAEFEKTITIDYNNIAGIIVQKNGIKMYENYFHEYTANHTMHVFSVTKSIVSVLIGIAIDKGHIKSVNQKILDFYPDYKVLPKEKMIQKITIKHLLTMTAPYKYEAEPYEEFFASKNWTNFALDLLGGDKPAGDFLYSPIVGAHVLSGILTSVTGQTVFDFARENLFVPLGIYVPHNVVMGSEEKYFAVMNDKNTSGWVVDPQGLNTASWGLFLRPVDMAKIGQLLLDGGMWEGKRIVSRGWIEESTREHSKWGNLSYGYLWWVINEKMHTYAAMGDGGNVIYVNTEKKMVIAIASLFVPEAKDRIEFILECVEPIFED